MPRSLQSRMKGLISKLRVYRLFLKIFVWFWSTAVALLLLVWLGFMSTGLKSVPAPNMYATVAPILASQAIQVYETNGVDGFRDFVKDNNNGPGTNLYLLDGNYRDVLGRAVEDEGLLTAHGAKLKQLVVYRGHIAAYRAVSSSGRPYITLLYIRGDLRELTHFLTGSGAPFTFVMFCVVFLFSLWLAHHIASPVLDLQTAARRVAQGDLTTRVPRAMHRRHDELALLGEDFDSMVERLATLIRSQRELLSAVSHEVRSPLARINLTLAILQRRAGPNFDDLLHRLDSEVQRIDRLVGQLLLLSRYEANLSSMDRMTVDLADLLVEVIADANFEANGEGKSVELVNVSVILLPHADPHAIRSAVENVIRNAVRFTPPGTAVKVGLYDDGNDRPHACRAIIRDHGPGVPKDFLKDIFQPFTQLTERAEAGVGNGLGLAIACEAMRMHGGTIIAENHPEGGLEVTLLFP